MPHRALMRYYQQFPAAIPRYGAGCPRVTHPFATKLPHVFGRSFKRRSNSVRLACVRHAASVHPEPGSNSHVLIFESASAKPNASGTPYSHERDCMLLVLWGGCPSASESNFDSRACLQFSSSQPVPLLVLSVIYNFEISFEGLFIRRAAHSRIAGDPLVRGLRPICPFTVLPSCEQAHIRQTVPSMHGLRPSRKSSGLHYCSVVKLLLLFTNHSGH